MSEYIRKAIFAFANVIFVTIILLDLEDAVYKTTYEMNDKKN